MKENETSEADLDGADGKNQEVPRVFSKKTYFERLRSLHRKYKATSAMAISYICMFLYFTIVSLINTAPPREKLQWISGKIISAQQKHPHLRVQFEDGSVKKFVFYADISRMFVRYPRGLFYDEDLAKYKGESATLGVYPVKWLILPYYDRVWEVRCKGFQLSYADIISEYKKSRKIEAWFHVIVNGLYISFILLIYNAERKRKDG